MTSKISLSTSPKKQNSCSNTTNGSADAIACNVRVVVRIRPLNNKELLHQSTPVITPKIIPVPYKSMQQPTKNIPSALTPSKSVLSYSLSVDEDEDDASITLSTTSSTNSRQSSIFHRFRRKPKLIKNLLSKKKINKDIESTTSQTKSWKKNSPSYCNKISDGTTWGKESLETLCPTVCIASNRQYEFDTVYGPETTNEEFRNHCFGRAFSTSNLLDEQVGGKESISNMTILAYGMTGTGKTYTMNMDDGVMFHVIQDIFCAKEQKNTSETISVKMSCFEIYADEIRDLLEPKNDSSSIVEQFPLKPALQLRDHGESIKINGLNEIMVNTADEVREHLQHAQKQRMTCSTQSNEQSSRSHAIYVFNVISTAIQQSNPIIISARTRRITWTLVDLAGSERIKDSGVTGMNRKESIHINTDLFVLGKVISSLHEQKVHIPYRDSKLTRILRNSLGGDRINNNCRTTFIACVSPAEMHLDESLNTLRYAERARSIVNNSIASSVQSNDLNPMTPEQIVALQEENTILRARIANLTRRQVMHDVNSIIGADRGGIKFDSIATKLHRAKLEAATIRQRTSFQQKQIMVKQNNNTELETLCESLRLEVDFVNSENDILRLQTNRLQDEIKRLRMKGLSDAPIIELEDSGDDDDDDNVVLHDPIEKIMSDHDKIRSHAERLLNWADEAIDRNRSSDTDLTCGSSTSNTSNGTDLRPLRSSDNATCPIFRARNIAENIENQFYISNLKKVESTTSTNGCPCEESVFTKQPEVIDFYLPKLGLLCSCGRKDTVPLIGSDPCSIENILRDWQVQFCNTYNIQTAADLIHVYTQNSNQLAKQMRAWRKENGMISVKTKSCGIALQIWARTCKTVIKTIQNQKDSGLVSRPDFLDVALSSDTLTVSTLGFCATSDDNAAPDNEMQQQ